jgi:hypothetical protein
MGHPLDIALREKREENINVASPTVTYDAFYCDASRAVEAPEVWRPAL